MRTYKWSAFGIISLALCGWLVRVSLIRATLVQQLTDATKEREAQTQTISTWKELDHDVSAGRGREGRECRDLKHALMFFRGSGIDREVLESFDLAENYSLFTRSDTGNGFFLQTDEESEVTALVRVLTAEEGEKRAQTQLKQTVESPDNRIALPGTLRRLTEYQFDTIVSNGELVFGCRLNDKDGSRFVAFRGIASRHDNYGRSGSDGPYDDGIFKNREFRVTYGWPDLCEINFVKALQKRGIWFIGCNEVFWLNKSEVLHVVLVFVSKREWRIHPDYLYCRSLNSGFDLEWDAQQQDYLTTPETSK
jgi:hypothetical protein